MCSIFLYFNNSAFSKHYDVDDGITSVDVVIFSAYQILDSREERYAAENKTTFLCALLKSLPYI